ncbi:F-box/WD-40 repeat-containing protein At5g21040-like [Amaranthus tricolor]|uniref:F-box/WD-40 repeat-containing protein At5g21040-like n=1 Tax=Amaranthus tricolor TaxID=29722 RepID=UPI00258AFC64|nr:F-box/WD-40 repeat-containing protein At5g21040-like [Amaranthus tricolor]
MAFECPNTSEDCLSEKLLNSVVVHNNPLEEQSACLQFGKTSVNCGKKRSFWRKKVEGCESLVPRLEFGSDKIVGVSKLVTVDEGHTTACRGSFYDLPPVLVGEILNCLDPKELGIVSCVSTNLCKIASDHSVWKDFYCERWGFPVAKPLNTGLSDEKSWKQLFVEREFRSKTFLGQYRPDFLTGHKEAVRTVFLLVSLKLVFTAGYDSVVRIWDMEEGLLVDSSRPLGCTIRAVAADTKLLAAGGTNGFIQCWKAVEGVSHLFDLKGSHCQNSEFRLWEHEGPVTSLALDLTRIYSGSWDMTVRIWDRVQLTCVMVLRHSDWVWSITPYDTTIASTSGSDVYIWDTTHGTLAGIIPQAHEGNTYALARSHTGDFLFTGGEDGSIHMFDISKCAEDKILKVASWVPHSGPVNSLAFEFPWVVSASSDGKLSLIDVRKLLKSTRLSLMKHQSRKEATIEPPQRMLHGSGGSLFSVDIGGDRIVSGGEDHVVKMWDFSRALERAMRARAQRAIRLENRMRQRRLQTEMIAKSGKTDKYSVVTKKNPINGDRNGIWHNKRSVNGKAKA